MAEREEEKRAPPEDEGNRARENAVMLGFFAVLGAAVLALLIARSLTRPIVQLTTKPSKPMLPLSASVIK